MTDSPQAGWPAESQYAGEETGSRATGRTFRRQLRICLTGYRSAPFSGGQGVYLKHLSRALLDAGQLVDVVSGPPYPELDERVRLIKLPSLDLHATQNRLAALRPAHLASFADSFEYVSTLSGGFPEPYTFGRRLVKFIARHGWQYDIIHDNQSLSYGILKLQQQGWPIVSTLHHPITRDQELALGSAPDWLMRLLVKRWHSFLFMQKRVLRKLQHLVAVSDFSRRDFADSFGADAGRIEVVHNGIDILQFRPMPEVQRQEQRLIAVASADVPLKGVSCLLQAVAKLQEKWPKLRLTLIGPLKPKGASARLMRELHIENRVESFRGLGSEELTRKYAEASLAVVPSLYEGFGLPAGEAMACGLPVVSSDGGALPEIVGEAGITVPKGDAAALASAIDRLLQDPGLRLRLGRAGMERVSTCFSWQAAAEKMLDYYHRSFPLSGHPGHVAQHH